MTAVAVHPSTIVTELGRHLEAEDIKALTSRISARPDSSGKASAHKPIIGFVFSNKGLMYNLSLEGNKISRLKR